MVLSWYACSLVGACAVTTNTRSAGAELEYFAQHTRCVAAITQPQFAALVTENAPGLKWVASPKTTAAPPRSTARRSRGSCRSPT